MGKEYDACSWDWRDGSVVKSPDRSSRGAGSDSQHPQSKGLTNIYNTSVRDPDALFWLLWESDMQMVLRQTCRQNTHNA